jgi:hypothetical protein
MAPKAEDIGTILGYPSSELIVEDVTSSERQVLSTPTIREERAGASLPSPDKLLAAYRVTSRNPATFHAILISVAQEGTFMTLEAEAMIEKIAILPDKPTMEGGRGPFGRVSIEGIGDGAIYPGAMKVPPRPGWVDPGTSAAAISVLRVPAQGIEIRIAVMLALQEGDELLPTPGGESYFETFSSKSKPVPFDALFQRLNSAIARNALPATSNPPSPPALPSDEKKSEVQEKADSLSTAPLEQPRAPKVGHSWYWLLASAVCLIGLVFALRRHQ